MGVAVITGAGRGLGKATAARLARDGHEVVALDLDAAAAEATAAAVGGTWHQCDVADWGSVEAAAARIDRCDILVNNAGIWRFHSLLDTTPDDLQSVIAVNIIGSSRFKSSYSFSNALGIISCEQTSSNERCRHLWMNRSTSRTSAFGMCAF